MNKLSYQVARCYARYLLAVLPVILATSPIAFGQADLVIHSAKVYTVDKNFSVAQALAIKNGKIIAVGTNRQILKKYRAKKVINASGHYVYPGFIDAHAHFVGYGQSLFQVDLYGAKNWDEAVERVKDFARKHPGEQWITGLGWDQNKWPSKSFPDNKRLDSLFPQQPVLLTRVDGHAAVANSKALQLAGIKAGDQLTGGEIEVKDEKLTGVLLDNAVDRVLAKLPSRTLADYEKWLKAAQSNCFAAGLTTVNDCGLMYYDVQAIDQLQQENKVQMKMYIMLSDDTANYARYLNRPPYKTRKMYVGGIKVYADGALGSRGACLIKPYNDRPGWYGFLLKDKAYFDSLAGALALTRYQMCTHAIGDSANREILHVYERALKGKNDRRWRIEHAQVIDTADFYLFGKNSVVPSVQPTHATSDMYWAEDRLGKQRLRGGYAYQQLLKENGWLPLGTDFPVEDISPLKTFLAAVFRKDANAFPKNGFQPENALSREDALRGMTIWAAKACFLEQETGSLEAGKRADLIITDKDFLKVSAEEVLTIRVLATLIDGQEVFSAPGYKM